MQLLSYVLLIFVLIIFLEYFYWQYFIYLKNRVNNLEHYKYKCMLPMHSGINDRYLITRIKVVND